MVKKKFIFYSAIFLLVLFSLNFVFSAITNSPTILNMNSTQGYYLFNITINNTNSGQTANITQVNITLPGGFLFVADSNGTNKAGYFTNTSTVLSWLNTTNYLINGSVNNSYFWFNASIPATLGLFNISIIALNGSGTNQLTNLTVRVQDTTAPLITLISPANANSTVVPASNIQFAFNVSDSSSLGITNCSLILNGAIINLNSSVNTTGGNNIFTNSSGYQVSNTWSINCTDSDNNGGNSSTYSFSLVSFQFNGTVRDASGNSLNNSNISVLIRNSAWNPVAVPSTQSNASGWFNLALPLNTGYMYQASIVHTNETNSAVDWVSQTLPDFPYQAFRNLYNINFYLKQAGTINITVRNSSDALTNGYAVQIKDTKLGYPVSCSGASGVQYFCNVPKDRNYSIMIYPSQVGTEHFVPVSFNWNNFASASSYNITDNNGANLSTYNHTTSTLHKQFNVTETLTRVTGYINGSSIGISGWSGNFTILPFILEPSNMIFMTYGILPWNASAWMSQSDIYNSTSGFYNITIPYSPAETVNYLLFAAAGNGTEFYGSYKNISVTATSPRQYNFTMYGLLGDAATINMTNASGPGTYIVNTKRQTFNLVNSTNSTLSQASAHIEATVDYSSIGIAQFTFMEELTGQGSATFSFPLLNISGFKEMNVFSKTYAPKRVSTRTASQIQANNNITLIAFNPQGIGSTLTTSSITISAYTSNSTCDTPNPPTNCQLTSFTQAQSEDSMLPLIVGGGAISLRITYSGVSVHYANVDLLASGPPSADFEASATTSTSGAFSSAMKFGSMGPTIYDYILIAIPYTPGSTSQTGLDESLPVNMSIPLLYDEDYNAPIWNVTANGTDSSALAGNYSHYSTYASAWGNLTSAKTCTTSSVSSSTQINETNPCYIDTTNDKIWIRIPHFSGTQPSISGNIITATSSSASTTGGSSASYDLAVNEKEVESGTTRYIAKTSRLKFTILNETHYVKLDSINSTAKKASITVSSSPQTFILAENETKKVDINSDSYYDLEVRLVKLVTTVGANIYIKKINEQIPASPAEEKTTTEKVSETVKESAKKAVSLSKSPILWIIIAAIIIIIIVILILVAKSRKRYYHKGY